MRRQQPTILGGHMKKLIEKSYPVLKPLLALAFENEL